MLWGSLLKFLKFYLNPTQHAVLGYEASKISEIFDCEKFAQSLKLICEGWNEMDRVQNFAWFHCNLACNESLMLYGSKLCKK